MGADGGSFRYPLEDIREKTDIVELISTYVNLKRAGRTLKALCPFHTEKTPSFTVNEDLQRWHCYGCSEHGDVFSFLMKAENMTFGEAVQELAKRAGVTIERSSAEQKQASDRERLLHVNSVAASFFSGALRTSAQATAYLRDRGVSQEAIDKYLLGYAPGEWRNLTGFLTSRKIDIRDAERAGLVIKPDGGSGHYDRFRDRVIFPIQDVAGKVIAFGGRSFGDEQPKYLNSPESPAFVKNRTLYGLNHARKSIAQQDRAIIVEGYLDAITAQCAGFENAVATMGTALTPEHVNLLSRYTHNVVIAFDSDSAGMAATLRSAPMFEQAGFDVRIVSMPPGQDPDSILRGGDTADFSRILAEALPVVDYRLKLLVDSSNLSSDEGKTEMLAKAVPILAEVASLVTRDRYVGGLARYHPGFGTGTTRAEEHIRKDIESYLGKRRTGGGAARPAPAPTPVATAKTPRSAVAMAERYLLRAMVADPSLGSAIFAELAPVQFPSSEGRTLAGVIAEKLATQERVTWDDLAAGTADTEAGNLLSELSIEDFGPDINDQAVEDCSGKLKTHWRGQRLRDLAARVERGELRSTDDEFTEYWRLVQELHNRVQKKS